MMRQKKNCDGCKALTEDRKCRLGYVMHTDEKEIIGKMIKFSVPDEPCPKPKTSTETMYLLSQRRK